MKDQPDLLAEAIHSAAKGRPCDCHDFEVHANHQCVLQAATVRAYLAARMPKPVDKITAAVKDWQGGRNHGLAEVRKAFGIEGKEAT